MSKDKFYDEKVCRNGYSAGSNQLPKNNNPYRGEESEDERRWDMAWERGNAGKEFDGWE